MARLKRDPGLKKKDRDTLSLVTSLRSRVGKERERKREESASNCARRDVSKSMPACNCHNKNDIVATRQLAAGENVFAAADYKYGGSFREAECNCRAVI